MYLLDTNVCIIYLKSRNLRLKERLEATNPQNIAVCSVVKAELFYGAMRSQDPSRNLVLQQEFLERFISLPFDDRAAGFFGEVRSELAREDQITELYGQNLTFYIIAACYTYRQG